MRGDSATKDPRFPPVTREELLELSLEISVLGPLEPIAPRPDAFTIGVHGLVAEQEFTAGCCCHRSPPKWAGTANSSCARLREGRPAARRMASGCARLPVRGRGLRD